MTGDRSVEITVDAFLRVKRERDEARDVISRVRGICDTAYGPGREDLAELVLAVLPEES